MICRKIVKSSTKELIRRPIGCDEIAPYTTIKTVPDIRIEQVEDYTVITSGDEVYVYPKSVWDRVSLYIDYFTKFNKFPNPGMLFAGPPGTGKTTLARVIADALGLDMIYFSFSEVLGPYVGQSEQRMQAKLDELMRSRPALMFMDEADTMLMARENMLSGGIGLSTADLNIKSMLLAFMPRIVNTDALIIAATNMSPRLIDDAFKREGRFGAPIYVPVPTKRAIEIFIERKFPQFVNRKQEIASKLASSMQNFANVVAYLKRLEMGIDAIPEDQRSGYAILYVDREYHDEKLDAFFASLNYPEIYFVQGYPDLAIPVLAAYFLHHGRGSVVLYNAQALNDAIKVAETYNAILIIDERSGIQPVMVFRLTNVPVVFVGEKLNAGEVFVFREYNEEMVRIIFSAYNIKTSRIVTNIRDLEKIVYHCKGAGDECIRKLNR